MPLYYPGIRVGGGSGGGGAAEEPDPFNPALSVTATTTLGSGGAPLDWWGRIYTTRRDDEVLAMVYRRGTSHMSATSNINIRFSADNGATWTSENTAIGGGAVSGFPMVPSTGNINAGEGMIITAPSGRLIMIIWRVDGSGDWPEDCKGNEISYSTDGGTTWSAPAGFTIDGVADNEHTFMTDDWFVFDDVIYTASRTYNGDNPSNSYTSLIKSEDDGDTWEKVSDITAVGSDTQEVGLEYVGNDCIVALVGSLNNDETIQGISTDMGATWTTSDVTGTPVAVTRRHKLYTPAHLRGEANWWEDTTLVASGFENISPGSGSPRRNMVLFGQWDPDEQSVTWHSRWYIHTSADDGGYGDIFYAGSPTHYSSVNYRGTLGAASIYQYDLTITGL